jgi:hypothetical protein
MPPGLRIHGVEDIQARDPHPAEICHVPVLSNDSTEGNLPKARERAIDPPLTPVEA